MGITDELRRYISGPARIGINDICKKAIANIADRIDAEHEAQLNDAFETRNSDENLESDGWIRLPVDADGEYIHIGDVMVSKDGDLHKVNSLTRNPIWFDYEWSVGLTLLNDVFGVGSLVRYRPDTLHHHTPDTWERIIEDAREYMLNIGGSYLWKNKSDELVARCKALAGDGTGGRNEHH